MGSKARNQGRRYWYVRANLHGIRKCQFNLHGGGDVDGRDVDHEQREWIVGKRDMGRGLPDARR